MLVCFQRQLYDLQIGYKPGKDVFDLDALSGPADKYKARQSQSFACVVGKRSRLLSVFSPPAG